MPRKPLKPWPKLFKPRSMADRTPWPELLQCAVTLGLQPSAFWRLSVREWRALSTERRHALSRHEFEALMRAHPDHPHE